MATPTRVPLGASTNVRKWYIDVNTGTHAAPVWVGIFGVKSFKPNFEAHLEDDSDFDSGGYQSQTKTAEAWSAELKIGRKVQTADATAYDPGQEYIRSKAIGKMGPENTVEVRFYEMTPGGPRAEAYQGYAAASWAPEGGEMSALDDVTANLTGQGKLEQITHPDQGDAVPALGSVSPTTGATAGGTLVILTGSGFTGATAVKFGTTDATSFTVISDGKIAAVSPASTGTKSVTVVNAAGASNGVNYTYA